MGTLAACSPHWGTSEHDVCDTQSSPPAILFEHSCAVWSSTQIPCSVTQHPSVMTESKHSASSPPSLEHIRSPIKNPPSLEQKLSEVKQLKSSQATQF